MKKTLFAMLAFALCSTALGGEYYASDYKNDYFGQSYDRDEPGYSAYEDILFIVNEHVNLDELDLYTVESVHFDFRGESSLSANCTDVGVNPIVVTGDTDAKIYWRESLTSPEGNVKTLTLISGTTSFIDAFGATFEELSQSGSLTLGDAKVEYLGYSIVADEEAAINLITGDNQVALVSIGGSLQYEGTPGQLALVGKISLVPEPTTATLSLLALAGLAARRRRK